MKCYLLKTLALISDYYACCFVNWCYFCFSSPQHVSDSGFETMETDDAEQQSLSKQVNIINLVDTHSALTIFGTVNELQFLLLAICIHRGQL